VQEQAAGEEFTVNFFVGRDGRCRAAVPHRRIATRGGEVAQGITVRQRELIAIADRIAQALPGAWGPMCYQAFVEPRGVSSEPECRPADGRDPRSAHDGAAGETSDPLTIRLIELNARFGGGYPLTHAAGANFIRWLIHDRLGRPIPESYPHWQAGLIMSRWDDAVFWTRDAAEQVAA
jgi:carbamoyl-phosphate synthase large subunit